MQKAQTVKPSKAVARLERAIQDVFDESCAKIEKEMKKEHRAYKKSQRIMRRQDMIASALENLQFRNLWKILTNKTFKTLKNVPVFLKYAGTAIMHISIIRKPWKALTNKTLKTLKNVPIFKKYAGAISKIFEKYAGANIMTITINTKRNDYKIFLSWRWAWQIASHCGCYNFGPLFIVVFSNEDLAIQE